MRSAGVEDGRGVARDLGAVFEGDAAHAVGARVVRALDDEAERPAPVLGEELDVVRG